MDCRGLSVRLYLILAYIMCVYPFVLMESDPQELDEGNVEERLVYLLKILQKVKELTQPTILEQPEPIIGYNNLDIGTLDGGTDLPQWPVDKSYERVIDIQKKDFSILPPSSEWCRLMGFRRCRNGSSR